MYRDCVVGTWGWWTTPQGSGGDTAEVEWVINSVMASLHVL